MTLLSAEDVAETLGVHVRTVRRYLREGRLKGVKFGKSYRIAAHELTALTGQPARADLAPESRRRNIESMILVQIDAIDPSGAIRVANALGGAARGRDKFTGIPLRVETIYDESRGRLKVMATGSLATAIGLLRAIEACSAR